MLQSMVARITALSLVLTGCSDLSPAGSSDSVRAARETISLLDTLAIEELSRSPETASKLGAAGDLFGHPYSTRIDDRSQAAFERTRLARIEALERLNALPGADLNPQLTRDKRVALWAYENAVNISAYGHGYVSLGYARPYAADHLSGAYVSLPDILINYQQVRNRQDALHYLARLSALAPAIDDEVRRLLADAEAGISPPDFILGMMADTASALGGHDLDGEHAIVQAFGTLLLGVSDISSEERDALTQRAQLIIQDEVRPAYIRFAAAMQDLSQSTHDQAGVWQLPQGDAYYADMLKFYTGSNLSPEDLHAFGHQLVARLSADLDISLSDAGYQEGSVGQRLAELSIQEDQIFSDDDEGRLALLTTLEEKKASIGPRLTNLISNPPRTGVVISAVPDALVGTVPSAYYRSAPADESAPAFFFLDMQDISALPSFSLPTLLFHETVPGHHLESAYIAQAGRLPLLRQIIWTPVFGEGWALYAEDLAHELGMYESDPLGEIGYLQSLLFRAARIVVDTGIHHQRWTREDAVSYLVEITGQTPASMTTEVDRYVVWPGQAASYMLGRLDLLRLRERAEEVLSDEFDLPEFHDVILTHGPRDMTLVEADIDAWIASKLPNTEFMPQPE